MTTADLVPASVGESVYQRVRDDLVMGRIPPGQRLRLERLREEYRVGVSTLRELLSRLAAEGLVVAEGQRGFEAAPASARDLRELAELRLVLESHAIRRAFAEADMEWEGRVVAAHHKLETTERRLLAAGDRSAEAWKRYDVEFHRALVSGCGSEALMAAHANAFDRFLRYLMIAFCFRGETALNEHRALRDAAIARDAEAAIRVLEVHVGACIAFALERAVVKDGAP